MIDIEWNIRTELFVLLMFAPIKLVKCFCQSLVYFLMFRVKSDAHFTELVYLSFQWPVKHRLWMWLMAHIHVQPFAVCLFLLGRVVVSLTHPLDHILFYTNLLSHLLNSNNINLLEVSIKLMYIYIWFQSGINIKSPVHICRYLKAKNMIR